MSDGCDKACPPINTPDRSPEPLFGEPGHAYLLFNLLDLFLSEFCHGTGG